jgi:hypothetical protein
MDLMIQGLTARRTTKDVNVEAARTHKGKGFSFTRRTIAILSVISIVVLPIIASMAFPDFALSYGWVENKGGFWFFTEGKDIMKYTTLAGMTILPFHTHLLAAIVAMYFGKDVGK